MYLCLCCGPSFGRRWGSACLLPGTTGCISTEIICKMDPFSVWEEKVLSKAQGLLPALCGRTLFMKRILSCGLVPTVCDHCFLASPVNILKYPALPLTCSSPCCKADPLPCFLPLPLPREGGCCSLLGSPVRSKDSSLHSLSTELCWGQSSGCRVWKSALCSAACQSLGQTWCQDEDHKHVPHVPQSCIQQCSLPGFMGFSPAPSLPLPWQLLFCTEKTGVSELSPLFLGRQVWEGPPARSKHKVSLEQLTQCTVFGFFSCSGLGALPWLLQGWTWRGAHTAAGAARLESTARVKDPKGIAGKCLGYWGSRMWTLCQLCRPCCCWALAPLRAPHTTEVPQGHVAEGWEELSGIPQQC